MNLVMRRRTSTGPSVNFGSGRTLRLGTSPLRGILALLTLSRSLRLRGSGSLRLRLAPGSPFSFASARSTLLGPLGAVLGPALPTVGDAGGVERAANDVVADPGEILHAAAADEDDRVLLEVVTLAGNVRGDLHPVGQSDAGDLAERRVRLLRRGRVHANADATLLGAARHRGRLALVDDLVAALPDQLANRRHRCLSATQRKSNTC